MGRPPGGEKEVSELIGKELREVLESNKNLVVINQYDFMIDDDGRERWTMLLYDKSKEMTIRLRVKRVSKNKIIVINA